MGVGVPIELDDGRIRDIMPVYAPIPRLIVSTHVDDSDHDAIAREVEEGEREGPQRKGRSTADHREAEDCCSKAPTESTRRDILANSSTLGDR